LLARRWPTEFAVCARAKLVGAGAREAPGAAPCEPESDTFTLAKAHFDLKEYLRAAHTLQARPSLSPLGACPPTLTRAAQPETGHDARFLRCYALYLAGEKRKGEEVVEVAGAMACYRLSPHSVAPDRRLPPQGRSNDVMNQELPQLEAELEPLFEAARLVVALLIALPLLTRRVAGVQGQLCAFGSFVYGLVLTGRERKAEARAALVRSVNEYPLHWGAWLALQALCPDVQTAAGLELRQARARVCACVHRARLNAPLSSQHWMREFFEASLALEVGDNAGALQRYQRLGRSFPASGYIASQACVSHYGLRAFEAAASGFEALVRRDPFRLEGLDIYSNILYVTEDSAALGHLAHVAVTTDKYRAETCCIVGNYYSLKGAHDKAVLYFRRALKLSPGYLAAWTLMGHEYVEMKNPHAAVEAYRAAVALSPRDYRAWYGLGQVYELLGQPLYALHYYQRAAALRPDDARMWCAIGMCYESDQLARADAALRCYRRALANNEREGLALAKLAKLHAAQGQEEEAAHYHSLNLARMDEEGVTGAELLEALQFLARHAADAGKRGEAERHCARLLDYGGPSKEVAKKLLRELRSGGGTGSPMQTTQTGPW